MAGCQTDSVLWAVRRESKEDAQRKRLQAQRHTPCPSLFDANSREGRKQEEARSPNPLHPDFQPDGQASPIFWNQEGDPKGLTYEPWERRQTKDFMNLCSPARERAHQVIETTSVAALP